MRPVLTILLLLVAFGVRAAPLQFCYEDAPAPPWTMPDGSGLNFALLKQVEALTGDQFVISRRPWARCTEETRLGRMDGMIGAADSPERRQFGMVPQLADGSPDPARAMYEADVYIFLRTHSGASWDGKTLHNPRGSIITQRGYFIGAIMRARGQHVIDTVKSAEEALRQLAAGSADVAVLMTQLSDQALHADPRFRGQVVKVALPYASFPLFLLVNRASYEQDPARIEAIWNAIATARASADYRKRAAGQRR